MRALRCSLYQSPVRPPLTTVTLESDVIDTLESLRHQLVQPGSLVIHDIFELSNEATDIEAATHEAMRRWGANSEQEAHQAMLYHWTVSKWGLLHEGGLMLMDKPAPLSRAEIEVVFTQLAQHPDYHNYRIVSHTRDGEPVELLDGKIKED